MFRLNGHSNVVVESGETDSNPINTGDMAAALMHVPAGFTGGTGATFLKSPTLDGTYGPVVDAEGVALAVTFAAGDVVPLPAELFMGGGYSKVKFGSSVSARTEVVIAHSA